MLSALSTTTAVSDWLTTATLTRSVQAVSPRVLHVFDQVCNLVDGERRVISLVTPEIGNGPFSLVVDLADSRFTDFIQVDSPVHIHPAITQSGTVWRPATASEGGFVLQVGSLVMDSDTAELWNARPLWETVSASAIKTHAPLFESKLAAAPSDSLAHVNGRSHPTALKAQTAVRTLQKGLETNELTACQEGARELAGLGVGLTPAGDDFLLGVIYGLWLAKNFSRKPAKTQRIIGVISEEAVGRTTTLSAAWLAAAARGEAGQAWHELVAALGDGEETACTERVEVAVSQAIDRILETGHTSGADALAGFVMATGS